MNKIKAVGDWELDVLAVPFGSPVDKDLDGEYFTAETDLSLDKFTDPLVIYHHGQAQEKAEVIGQSLGHTIKPDGVWLRVKLNQANKFAERVWRAAQRGLAAASSGSIAHLVRRAKDGFIAAWPFVELSLFDMDESQNRMPANPAAVAIPAKSIYSLGEITQIYKQAGRSFPETETEAARDAEEKALKDRAIQVLAELEIERVFRERAFDRPPTETEQLYEAAAIGVVKHFGNTHLKSFPVRFMEVMPDGYKGAKLAGMYEGDDHTPQILLKHRGDAAKEYQTFLHEVGHAVDHALRGDAMINEHSPAAKAEKEAKANEYKKLIGFYAFDQARRQFYGGKMSVKSIPITRLLEALK